MRRRITPSFLTLKGRAALGMMRNRRLLDTVFPSQRKTGRSGRFLFTFADVARHHAC
jgi:hypothetical protein